MTLAHDAADFAGSSRKCQPFPCEACTTGARCRVSCMPTSRHRTSLSALAFVLALLALAGCGKAGSLSTGAAGPARKLVAVAPTGAVSLATRNTTRLGGADVASDAAAVARAVYPGLTATSRPAAVVLVSTHDWPAALAASVLTAAPTNTPILYSEGEALPAISRQTLEAMHPLGAAALGGAQVIRIGTNASLPGGYPAHTLPAAAAAAIAAQVAQLASTLEGSHAPHAAIVIGEGVGRKLAMPAAGLSAES